MRDQKILVLTSCTAKKCVQSQHPLVWEDFCRGKEWVHKREKSLGTFPAGTLYTGEQHVRLMRAVKKVRAAGVIVEVWILSAGYGLIPEIQMVAPYESTFLGLSPTELKIRAARLELSQKIPTLLNRSDYDLGLILLGEHYLKTFSLGELRLRNPVLILGSGVLLKLPSPPMLNKIVLDFSDTKSFRCGMVGLKGEVAARILSLVADSDKCHLSPLNKAMLLTRYDGPGSHRLF